MYIRSTISRACFLSHLRLLDYGHSKTIKSESISLPGMKRPRRVCYAHIALPPLGISPAQPVSPNISSKADLLHSAKFACVAVSGASFP